MEMGLGDRKAHGDGAGDMGTRLGTRMRTAGTMGTGLGTWMGTEADNVFLEGEKKSGQLPPAQHWKKEDEVLLSCPKRAPPCTRS